MNAVDVVIRTSLGLTLSVAGLLVCFHSFSCSDEVDSACEATKDCSSGEACYESFCTVVECASNLDCPADAICYVDLEVCGEHECRTDQDCFDNRRNPFCVSGRCTREPPPECEGRSSCGTGQVCTEQVCTDIGAGLACEEDEECGNPQVCDPSLGEDTGGCIDPCEDNSDCDDHEDPWACELSTGFCTSVECLNNLDCDEFEECNDDYTCVLLRYDCETLDCALAEGRPFQTEPVDGQCRCVQCLDHSHCNQANLEVCTDSRRCLFCETTATTASDCPEELPYFREGCCVECRDDAGCIGLGMGSVCTNGRCVGCDCLDVCPCPETAECIEQADGTGRCLPRQGSVGDACVGQESCGDSLACSYATGFCVEQGAGSFCGTSGCPEPSRCASVTDGALCYGCHGTNECPSDQICDIPEEWVGVYDGGRCLPDM